MGVNQYLGEISIVAFNFSPRGWAFCNGQLLSLQQNQALFSILGTTYGGNGVTTFALPDFRGRAPFHTGTDFSLGQVAGEFTSVLTTQQIPAHLHQVSNGNIKAKTGTTANKTSPVNNYFASNSVETKRFTAIADTTMGTVSASIANSGGNQPHENMQPYLALNFVIALVGVFPSRN
ncbi:phage tail protein [Pedobacter ginsengisoli]|uniref:Phage tail protein n=1 Tax=Pedobacter ginsengisoli TaxID=363852 RepID=A0A2D1U749_9SPHI|nr:tail fiber protein [Pedobacter ginsengisoli]ATP57435.1 phage tail protein [Pedobacter ginsengisoli]